MQKPEDTYVAHHVGDKIRISVGNQKGQRGIIQDVTNRSLEVKLENGETIAISPQDLTNFSLAARKAWRTMRRR
jgi:transcription elongation factor